MLAWLTAIGFTMFIGKSVGSAARDNNNTAIQFGSLWVIAIWYVMFRRREWLYVVTWGMLAAMLAWAIGGAIVYRTWKAVTNRIK